MGSVLDFVLVLALPPTGSRSFTEARIWCLAGLLLHCEGGALPQKAPIPNGTGPIVPKKVFSKILSHMTYPKRKMQSKMPMLVYVLLKKILAKRLLLSHVTGNPPGAILGRTN